MELRKSREKLNDDIKQNEIKKQNFIKLNESSIDSQKTIPIEESIGNASPETDKQKKPHLLQFIESTIKNQN